MGKDLLLLVDYYSRWVEIKVLHGLETKYIIAELDEIWATHGLPTSSQSDNGPQFASNEFCQYMKALAVDHKFVSPLWPQANRKVERQNRSLLKCLKISHLDRKSLKEAIYLYLFFVSSNTPLCY